MSYPDMTFLNLPKIKFISKTIAQEICNECMINFNMDLVVVPIVITYEIIEE